MDDVIRTFRITTYFKRKRGAPGVRQVSSVRLTHGQALDWLLGALPDEAWTVEHNGAVSVLTIDWAKVPGRGMGVA